MDQAWREGVVRTARHTSFYLECGPAEGPLLVFLHGWPELAISWRHQLPCFAAMGFRCIAPDMRGYGRSSVHPAPSDYALEPIAGDMLELLAGLGRERAVWVGHDWGSPVVWSLAAHHPDRCLAVANLCVPYIPNGFALPNLVALVDRRTYPAAEYPAGQWDYQFFYEENAARARAVFEADVDATVRALFRHGNPAARGKPGRTATIRRDGGWFGGADRAPDVPLDEAVLTRPTTPATSPRCPAMASPGRIPGTSTTPPMPPMPPVRGMAAGWRCRCCSCTAPTTPLARPWTATSPGRCGRPAPT
jgi:pimeloyl-ACP methyl ester carboxylesterase